MMSCYPQSLAFRVEGLGLRQMPHNCYRVRIWRIGAANQTFFFGFWELGLGMLQVVEGSPHPWQRMAKATLLCSELST